MRQCIFAISCTLKKAALPTEHRLRLKFTYAIWYVYPTLWIIILCSVLGHVILTSFSLSVFFSMSVFPSKEIYHFTTVGQEKLSSYLSVPYNFLPTLRNATVSLDYHPNTEISYLEVVSLPPLKPASLVIVSNSLPCSRRCWSWTELMSWPEIFPQCWKQTARFFLLKTMAFKICFLQHLPH